MEEKILTDFCSKVLEWSGAEPQEDSTISVGRE
jgi:hypothetical protein